MEDKKRGRPKKRYLVRKSKEIRLRLSPLQYDQIRVRAERDGVTISEYIRSCLPIFQAYKKQRALPTFEFLKVGKTHFFLAIDTKSIFEAYKKQKKWVFFRPTKNRELWPKAHFYFKLIAKKKNNNYIVINEKKWVFGQRIFVGLKIH